MLIIKSPTLTIVESKPIILTIANRVILKMIAPTLGSLEKSTLTKQRFQIIFFSS